MIIVITIMANTNVVPTMYQALFKYILWTPSVQQPFEGNEETKAERHELICPKSQN